MVLSGPGAVATASLGDGGGVAWLEWPSSRTTSVVATAMLTSTTPVMIAGMTHRPRGRCRWEGFEMSSSNAAFPDNTSGARCRRAEEAFPASRFESRRPGAERREDDPGLELGRGDRIDGEAPRALRESRVSPSSQDKLAPDRKRETDTQPSRGWEASATGGSPIAIRGTELTRSFPPESRELNRAVRGARLSGGPPTLES